MDYRGCVATHPQLDGIIYFYNIQSLKYLSYNSMYAKFINYLDILIAEPL